MKRLIVCCDGTWQNLETDYPTNVVQLVQVIKNLDKQNNPQIVFYDAGVGTGGIGDKIKGGAFGKGINRNIIDCYLFLILNYEPDDEIYLFGFSRGSYTVRSLAGLIYCSGLPKRKYIRKISEAFEIYRDPKIKPSKERASKFRSDHCNKVAITLLGCWDTVGALGVPDIIPVISWLANRKYKFHDTTLNQTIKNALHAVAIDERRKVFNVTLMEKTKNNDTQRLRQVWFAGDHGCIGGGSEEKSPLSNITFQWMIDGIQQCGLKLDLDLTQIKNGVNRKHDTPFNNSVGLYVLAGTIDRTVVGIFEDIDISVKRRWRDCPNYRPKKLVSAFSPQLDAWQEEDDLGK